MCRHSKVSPSVQCNLSGNVLNHRYALFGLDNLFLRICPLRRRLFHRISKSKIQGSVS